MDLNLFEYIDYREYLRDAYARLKRADTKVSHRYIAQKVGFSSSSFFSQVIKRQSNISSKLIFSFARFLKLNRKETEYFSLLVQFNQAKSHEEKKHFYEKVLSYRRPKAKKIETSQYELLNKWYYIAIRQLLSVHPFKEDYKSLAKMVVPPIKPSEAKKAVELLRELKMIKRNEEGFYKCTAPSITTGDPPHEVGIQAYLVDTLRLARQAIDRFPKEDRKLSSLTLSLSEKGKKAIEERLAAFRKELLEIAEHDEDVDRVCHLNLQFFPMSKLMNRRKG